eukprot:jgi/Hompol1/6477/HPOL_002675-RA
MSQPTVDIPSQDDRESTSARPSGSVARRIEPRMSGLSPLAAQLAAKSEPSSPSQDRKARSASHKNINSLANVLSGSEDKVSEAAASPSMPNMRDIASDSASSLPGSVATSPKSSRKSAMQDNSATGSPLGSRMDRDDELGGSSRRDPAPGLAKFTPKKKAGTSATNSPTSSTTLLSSGITIYEARYIQDIAPLMPKMLLSKYSRIRSTWTSVRLKKLEMMEKLLVKIADPSTGIQQKKKMMSQPKYSLFFNGQDVFEWIMANYKFLIREEGIKLAQELVEYGYLISAEGLDKFDPSPTSTYVIQLPSMWPTRTGEPTDIDYAVSLLKRGMHGGMQDILKFYEEDRLDALHNQMKANWADIEAKVAADSKLLGSLKGPDRRLFRLQEAGFWRIHRPAPGVTNVLFTEESGHKSVRRTDQEYIDSLSVTKRLAFLEKRLEYLQQYLLLNRCKASVSAKSMVASCKLFETVDPLMTQASNPWINDSTAVWDNERTVPTKAEVQIWCNSLADLLRDPLGVKYFDEFLAKEFSQENLQFYLKCRDLENVQSADEFLLRSMAIFKDYIKVGSPRELNINSNTRSAIIAVFEPKDGSPLPPSKDVSCNVFRDATDHIFSLMSKDSYSRFCSSDGIQALLASN